MKSGRTRTRVLAAFAESKIWDIFMAFMGMQLMIQSGQLFLKMILLVGGSKALALAGFLGMVGGIHMIWYYIHRLYKH